MAYNGSGTFVINSSGQPVVTGTTISSTVFNALTADLATGLSTAITKDGQTATTARVPFIMGINSSLTTDSTNTTSGSIITAGGIGVAKAVFIGTTLNLMGASSGSVTLQAPAIAGSSVLTLPVATDTLVGKATTDTLTNKTISAASNTFNMTPITNSLGADVALNNTGTYFDGPSIAQGTSGTWFVSGSVTVYDTVVPVGINAKLWDGTTVIASANMSALTAGNPIVIALSGYIASPAGNLRISVKDLTAITGKILFNQSGNSKDSTITAIRIG